MKTSLFAILLLFSCLSLVSAQKKYSIKIKTLDNRTQKGWLFNVADKGIFVLKQQQRFNPKSPKSNLKNAKFIDFNLIKAIKIRKRGSVGKGVLIGYFTTFGLGLLYARVPGRDLGSAVVAITFVPSLGAVTGGFIGGSYPHQFTVKNDSTSIQSLKTELKKYEWYHAEKDTLIIK
jgi:hypothetical protein